MKQLTEEDIKDCCGQIVIFRDYEINISAKCVICGRKITVPFTMSDENTIHWLVKYWNE